MFIRTLLCLHNTADGLIGTTSLLHTREEFVSLLNRLVGFDRVGLGKLDSASLQMVTSQASLIVISFPPVFVIIMILVDHVSSSSLIKMALGKFLAPGFVKGICFVVDIWEIWSFTWVLSLMAIQLYCGVLQAYAAICKGVATLLKNSEDRIILSKNSFFAYRRLQVLTCLTNQCFQDRFAICTKMFVMSMACITGTVSLSPKIREAISLLELLFAGVNCVEVYCIMIFGYAFPGMANRKSGELKVRWRKHIWQDRRKCTAWERRMLWSCQDIRIRFGSVNYYEKATSLVIVQFTLEKTMGLMLVA